MAGGEAPRQHGDGPDWVSMGVPTQAQETDIPRSQSPPPSEAQNPNEQAQAPVATDASASSTSGNGANGANRASVSPTGAADFEDAPHPQPSKSVIAMERENFLIFVKILFKVLDNQEQIKARAKRIVTECQRRNRLGDPTCTPLMEGVSRRMRHCVGEANWQRTHMLLHHFLSTRRQRSLPTMTEMSSHQQSSPILASSS